MRLDLPPLIPSKAPERELASGKNPYLPAACRVMRIRELTADVRLYDLRFADEFWQLAPDTDLYRHFGITAEAVAEKVKSLL